LRESASLVIPAEAEALLTGEAGQELLNSRTAGHQVLHMIQRDRDSELNLIEATNADWRDFYADVI